MATMDILVEERIGCSKSHKDLCKFAESDDLYERIDQTLGYDPSGMLFSILCQMRITSDGRPQLLGDILNQSSACRPSAQ